MLTVYFAKGTCALASHIALEDAGADYEARRIDFGKTEQQSPAYLAINPNGKVPALRDGDAVLFDSSAILLYLGEKTGKFLPKPLLERIPVLEWLALQSPPGQADNAPSKSISATSSMKSPGRTGLAFMKYWWVSLVKPVHMKTLSTSWTCISASRTGRWTSAASARLRLEWQQW
jgi:hypothetical protein